VDEPLSLSFKIGLEELAKVELDGLISREQPSQPRLDPAKPRLQRVLRIPPRHLSDTRAPRRLHLQTQKMRWNPEPPGNILDREGTRLEELQILRGHLPRVELQPAVNHGDTTNIVGTTDRRREVMLDLPSLIRRQIL